MNSSSANYSSRLAREAVPPAPPYSRPVLASIFEWLGALQMLGAAALLGLSLFAYGTDHGPAGAGLVAVPLFACGGIFLGGLFTLGVGQAFNLLGQIAHASVRTAQVLERHAENSHESGKHLASVNANTRRTAEALSGAEINRG